MSVQFAILRYLQRQEAHGFALHKLLAELRHFYPLTNVNVYPLLKSLEEEGMVRSHVEASTARPRNVYEITDAGRQSFDRWLTSNPEQPLPAVRDPVSLRLALAPPDCHGLEWLGPVIRETRAECDAVHRALDDERELLSALALLAREELVERFVRRIELLERAEQIAG